MDKENTKYDTHSLGLESSRSLALNHLYNLEHCLSKDEELYNAYRDFMDECTRPYEVGWTRGRIFHTTSRSCKTEGE